MRYLLGFGGNVGDVPAAFAAAARCIRSRFGTVRGSSLWRSAPLGPPQPAFLNAALLLDADVHPARLLADCLALEAAAGRDRRRESRWGPRPLDLDLLLADGLVLEGPDLTLPHPRLHARRFALLPAVELAPDWTHPRLHRLLADLAAALDPAEQPCTRVGDWRPEA